MKMLSEILQSNLYTTGQARCLLKFTCFNQLWVSPNKIFEFDGGGAPRETGREKLYFGIFVGVNYFSRKNCWGALFFAKISWD